MHLRGGIDPTQSRRVVSRIDKDVGAAASLIHGYRQLSQQRDARQHKQEAGCSPIAGYGA